MIPRPKPERPTPPTPPSSWNVANALTVGRVFLVPVFAWALLREGGESTGSRLAAFATFALAMVTDQLDGAIARRRGLVTTFGKVVDPIADKALTGTAFVGLSLLGELPWWVTLVVLGREVGVTALRFVVIRHGVIPASSGGKVKTALQALALGLFVLPLSPGWDPLRWGVMVVAVVVTVATGLDYVLRALVLRRTSARAAAKRQRRPAL